MLSADVIIVMKARRAKSDGNNTTAVLARDHQLLILKPSTQPPKSKSRAPQPLLKTSRATERSEYETRFYYLLVLSLWEYLCGLRVPTALAGAAGEVVLTCYARRLLSRQRKEIVSLLGDRLDMICRTKFPNPGLVCQELVS